MATLDLNFPTEPIGGGNPYHRCLFCKRSVPEINGELERHHEDCEWLKIRKQEDRNTWKNKPPAENGYFWVISENKEVPEIVLLINGDVFKISIDKTYPLDYFEKWKGPIDENHC